MYRILSLLYPISISIKFHISVILYLIGMVVSSYLRRLIFHFGSNICILNSLELTSSMKWHLHSGNVGTNLLWCQVKIKYKSMRSLEKEGDRNMKTWRLNAWESNTYIFIQWLNELNCQFIGRITIKSKNNYYENM